MGTIDVENFRITCTLNFFRPTYSTPYGPGEELPYENDGGAHQKFPKTPLKGWLESSVDKTRFAGIRRGHGFDSRSSLNFFRACFSQLLKLSTSLRLSFIC